MVTLLFLVPLMLCAAYLAGLLRAEQTAVLATREFAVASMLEPSGDPQPDLIRRLHELAMPADEIPGELAPPRLERMDLAGTAVEVEALAIGMLAPARAGGVGNFDLPLFRATRARAGVSMGSTKALGVDIDMPVIVDEQLVFFVGHGAAKDPEQVRARTAALSAAGVLAEAARPIELIATIASVVEPALRQLCAGRIDPEIVPADRLPDDVTRSSDLRYRPC